MMCVLVLLTSYVHFLNTHSLVRIVSRTLLAEIRSNSVIIAIVTCVIVQQKTVKCGVITAKQHTAIPIGREKERRLNELEFVRRHNRRQYRRHILHQAKVIGETHPAIEVHQPSFP